MTAALFAPATASAAEFETGSLIIPMDLDYQDDGMFKAFGLVYQLLLADIHVHWAILEDKDFGDADFVADAFDVSTGAVIHRHGYRAGPFVVDASDAERAMLVVSAWQAEHITAVHEATAGFETDVSQTLVSAPTIAMFADGNEDIARGYLLAAGIPDSTGDLTWPDDSPDMLSIEELAGPTDTNHSDGALFDDSGVATYCQLMSMHWRVRDAERNPEVVAEVRSFLRFPTHFFAECQAVNAFENSVNGRFLTPFGFAIDNVAEGATVDFYNADSTFAQIDEVFAVVGGSERSYTPCSDEECSGAGEYLAGGVVMITEADTPEGTRDVWMTGFLDGSCPPDVKVCEDDGDLLGKVSYLGGHEYRTDLPLSVNPSSGGTRLFLQSLFEAPCATLDGQPIIQLTKTGPSLTTDGSVTYTLTYENTGGSVALNVIITDPLPDGAAFAEVSGGGAEVEGVVTWDIGNVEPGVADTLSVVVTLATRGDSVENVAGVEWEAGVSERSAESNSVTTLFDDDRDGDDVGDSVDICPDDHNPGQDLDSDAENCGACGVVCESGACSGAECSESGSDAGEDAGAGDTGEDADVGADDTGAEDVGANDTGADDTAAEDTAAEDAPGSDADASGNTEDVPIAEDLGLGDGNAGSGDGVTTLDTPGASLSGSGCGCVQGATPAGAPAVGFGLFAFVMLVRTRRLRA